MQPLNIETQICGLFRFEKFKTDDEGNEVEGSRRLVADWFPNLILNQGMDLLATSQNLFDACQVGSGSAAPAVGQTALSARIAGSTQRVGATVTTASSAPYYVAYTVTYRFDEGAAAGNISEVGVGTQATGTNLFSRSLIKDSTGNPTTITILPDESLDVLYQFRYYAPPVDVTGTVVATGNIGGTYDFIMRAANVTSTNAAFGWTLPGAQNAVPVNTSGFFATSENIAAITSGPAYSQAAITPPTAAAYTPGSFYIDRIITASAAQANISGGVRSFLLKLGIGTYQIQFDPNIPKTSADVIQLTLRLSWARRP